MIDIAPEEARRAALWSAGLLGGQPTPAALRRAPSSGQSSAVRSMLSHLGAVQLDTISVLARSHELIAYARLGALRRTAIEDAYWDGDTA